MNGLHSGDELLREVKIPVNRRIYASIFTSTPEKSQGRLFSGLTN